VDLGIDQGEFTNRPERCAEVGVEDLFAVRVSGNAVVECQGEMDICAEAPLREALARAMHDHPTQVQVDLSQVRYIDSACIAVLLRASDTLRQQGGSLVLTAASPVVCRALSLLGLDQRLRPGGIGEPPRGSS